jgi:hypothetical protein
MSSKDALTEIRVELKQIRAILEVVSIRPHTQGGIQPPARSSHLPSVIEAWHGLFGDRPATCRDVITLAFELRSPEAQRLDLALRAMCKETGSPLTAKILSHWVSSHEGVEAGGKSFSRCGFRDHSILWRLRVKP